MTYELDFSEAPAIGYLHKRFTHTYELVDVRPHTRRDGSPTKLLTWLCECADCGAPFYVKTGLAAKSLNRRCKSCAKPRKAASKEAQRSKRNAGRRAGRRIAAAAKARKAERELFS